MAIFKLRLDTGAHYSKNADNLFDILQQEWTSTPETHFHNLASSMPRQVQLGKVNKGKFMKYRATSKIIKIRYNFLLHFALVHTQPKTFRKYP